MINFIEYLRAIAAVLIANSHFKGVYPSDILSFGGGFGLALFYMISGYLLSGINKKTRFSEWYLKKVIQLYIPLYLVRIIEIFVGRTVITTWWEFFKAFIFPGSWFGGSMVLMYALYYLFVTKIYDEYGKNAILIALLVDFTIYIGLFIIKPGIASFSLATLQIEEFSIETPYLISQCIWFFCMLLGLYLKKHGKTIENNNKKKVYLLYMIMFIVLFMSIKLLIRNGDFLSIQSFLGFSYIGFAYCLFILFMSSEEICKKYSNNLFGKLIFLISSCSLEIYYTQFLWIGELRKIIFPINLIVLLVVIIMTAYMVHIISGAVLRKIGYEKDRNRRPAMKSQT